MLENLRTWLLNPSVFYPLLLWSITWKGIALWNSARRNQLVWYIALLLINTAGLLEIIYMLFFRAKSKWSVGR